MNNGLILIAVLLIVLIYFVMQIPRKHTNHKSEVVYVNRQYPLWNIPTGLARPLRRSWGWGPRFRRGYGPRRHRRFHF
jgi:hypothetical protein